LLQHELAALVRMGRASARGGARDLSEGQAASGGEGALLTISTDRFR